MQNLEVKYQSISFINIIFKVDEQVNNHFLDLILAFCL